jgi:hypothetical protein
MAGRHQKAEMQRNPPFGWQMQFAYLGASWADKVTCIICGTRGYPGGTYPNGWQMSCLLGHPDQCPGCGARFVKGGLSKHLNCRSNHGTCCGCHTNTKHQRLQRHLEQVG